MWHALTAEEGNVELASAIAQWLLERAERTAPTPDAARDGEGGAEAVRVAEGEAARMGKARAYVSELREYQAEQHRTALLKLGAIVVGCMPIVHGLVKRLAAMLL